MRNRIALVFILAFLLLFIPSCETNHYTGIEESSLPSEIEMQPAIMEGTPSISELHSIVQSSTADPLGYYKTILAFLEGDTDELARLGRADLDITDYDHITTIKIDKYEIIENENGSLDFRFVVSDRGKSFLEEREHQYKVGEIWIPLTQKTLSEEYVELVEIIDWMTAYGCISWENGKSTSSFHYAYTFDFGVNRAIRRVRGIYLESGNELPAFDFDDAIYKMFGMEEFSSTSQYLVFENGEWDETQYIGNLDVVNTIVDIRESNDYIEVDVQYYADRYQMIPSIMTTMYIKKTQDPIYKYYFDKSVIVKTSEYDPLWWA